MVQPDNVVAAPAALSPRSKRRRATKQWKAEARSRDLVGYKAKRAEQERNRQRKKKEQQAAMAAFEAEAQVVSGTISAVPGLPPPPLAPPPPLLPPPQYPAPMCLPLPYGKVPPPTPPPPIPVSIPPISPPTPLVPSPTPPVPLTIAPPAQPPAPPVSDGRTFEQRKIKELKGQVKDLKAAVQTRDNELKGFADSLYTAVKGAMKARDKPHSVSDLSDLSIPPSVMIYPHKPEDNECRCAFCFALSFMALPLAQRAAYIERARSENV